MHERRAVDVRHFFIALERDVGHPELYLSSQTREKDVVVRKKICEMLVVLTRTHFGRERMRERKVYPIVREMHTHTTMFVNTLKRRRGTTRDLVCCIESVLVVFLLLFVSMFLCAMLY